VLTIRFRRVLEKFSEKTIIVAFYWSKQLTLFKVSNALIAPEVKPLSNHCNRSFLLFYKQTKFPACYITAEVAKGILYDGSLVRNLFVLLERNIIIVCLYLRHGKRSGQ